MKHTLNPFEILFEFYRNLNEIQMEINGGSSWKCIEILLGIHLKPSWNCIGIPSVNPFDIKLTFLIIIIWFINEILTEIQSNGNLSEIQLKFKWNTNGNP